MLWLICAGFVYAFALIGSLIMATADSPAGMLFAALGSSVLWVAAMYLVFRGLIEVGTFDELVSR